MTLPGNATNRAKNQIALAKQFDRVFNRYSGGDGLLKE